MKIKEFYKRTSTFTDLGLYAEFARSLPDDILTLCRLQRKQIIHPVAFREEGIREKHDTVWGDMTEVPAGRLRYEDDLFPTAQAILHELLRRNPVYDENRTVKDKVHVTCRGEALLLAGTLKAKGFSARVRSGYAGYINDRGYADHWIVEYWNEEEGRWILCDADIYGFSDTVDPADIERAQFLTGGQAWTAYRTGKVAGEKLLYASGETGSKAALLGVIYDYNCLMGNEMTFLHFPESFAKEDQKSEEFMKRIDHMAELIANPDDNFDTLCEIWDQNPEWKTFIGGIN